MLFNYYVPLSRFLSCNQVNEVNSSSVPLFDDDVVLPLRLWSISMGSLVTRTTLVLPFCCPLIYGTVVVVGLGFVLIIVVESLM